MRNGFDELLDGFQKTLEALMKQKQENECRQENSPNFASLYYKKTLASYLSIIRILKKYSASPKDLAQGCSHDSARILELLRSIDSSDFIPKLFHPIYVDSKKCYALAGDENCYRLAKKLQAFFEILQTEGNRYTTWESLKKIFADKITRTQYYLEERISRFEYNAAHADTYEFFDKAEVQLRECQALFEAHENHLEQSTKFEALQKDIAELEKYAPIFGEKIKACYTLVNQAITENTPHLLEDAREDYDLAKKDRLVIVENIKLARENASKIPEFHKRFEAFLAHPKPYQSPTPRRPLTIEILHDSMAKTIDLVREALDQKEGSCTQFLRDKPQEHTKTPHRQDTYPPLLEKYFKREYETVLHCYLHAEDTPQICVFSVISEGAKRISRHVKNAAQAFPSDKKLNSFFMELNTQLKYLDAREKAHAAYLSPFSNSLIDLLNINQKLYSYFSLFEGQRLIKNGFSLFHKHPLDDRCEAFHMETDLLYHRIEGLRTMSTPAKKYLAPQLAQALMEKLLTLKEDLCKTKGYEEYPGFHIVKKALDSWPNLIEEPEFTHLPRQNPQ